MKRDQRKFRLTHKLTVLIVVSVSAVAFSGFYAGSALIRQMSELANDATLVESLANGKRALVEWNHTRQSWAEQSIQNCLSAQNLKQCTIGELAIDFTEKPAEMVDPNKITWVSEQEAAFIHDGKTYSAKIGWESIKPAYNQLSTTLQTREHLIEIFPNIPKQAITIFGIMIIAIGSLACFVAVIYGRTFTKGINALVAFTQAIGTGDSKFEASLLKRHDEVGILARALQNMTVSLEKTRKKLIHSEKMASWQNVARKIAHEIKNPLTPISLVGAELGRRAPLAAPPLKEFLEEAAVIIAEEIQSLNRMVKDFTQFARLPEPQMKNEDLAIVVQDFIARNARDSGPLLTFTGVATAAINADKAMLHQIFFNISNNAALAKLPARVTLAFTLKSDADHWLLDLADDGPGVPESIRDTLFDAYVTTRSTGDGEKGMGLGLAISRKIAMDHEGSLVLTGTSAKGSVFTLTLPKARSVT